MTDCPSEQKVQWKATGKMQEEANETAGAWFLAA